MRSRFLVFALVLALSLGMVLQPSARNVVPNVPRVHGANITIHLIGVLQGWNFSQPSGANPTITVSKGDMVTIDLSSSDVSHEFALDIDKDSAMFNGVCPTGDQCSAKFFPSTTSITIDTSTLSGNYAYFCIFHSTMLGTFTVVTGTVGGVGPLMPSSSMPPYAIIAILVIAVAAAGVYVIRSRGKNRP